MLDEEETEREAQDGAGDRIPYTEIYQSTDVKEDKDELDYRKMSIKTVSTKKSGKRSKSISSKRGEDQHTACCSKKKCNLF